jgi:hypothetical protein
MQEKVGEVNSTKADKTNAATLCQILNDCYASRAIIFEIYALLICEKNN